MQDLRSQLMAKLGATEPSPDPVAVSSDASDILGPSAHLDSPWFASLQQRLQSVGLATLPSDAKLTRCRQATDVVAKQLKKTGQRQAARELLGLRDDLLARRARAAWSRIKTRLNDVGVSSKGYRSLKQGGHCPERLLERLNRLSDADISGVGPERLRKLLTDTTSP